MIITSLQNPGVKFARSLRNRKATQCCAISAALEGEEVMENPCGLHMQRRDVCNIGSMGCICNFFLEKLTNRAPIIERRLKEELYVCR